MKPWAQAASGARIRAAKAAVERRNGIGDSLGICVKERKPRKNVPAFDRSVKAGIRQKVALHPAFGLPRDICAKKRILGPR